MVPVNMIIAAIRQPCWVGDTHLSYGGGLALALQPFSSPSGACSCSLFPSLDPLPRGTRPTYEAQDLDLGVPHNPELSIAVLEFPLVAATPLPRAHFILGLHGLFLFLGLLVFLVFRFGVRRWRGRGRSCGRRGSRFALFAFVSRFAWEFLTSHRLPYLSCCPRTGLASERACCPPTDPLRDPAQPTARTGQRQRLALPRAPPHLAPGRPVTPRGPQWVLGRRPPGPPTPRGTPLQAAGGSRGREPRRSQGPGHRPLGQPRP